MVRSEDPTKEVSDGSDPPRRGGRRCCPLCERRSSLGGLRGRNDHVAEYDDPEYDDSEHDAAQLGELPEHGLVVRLVELVRRGVRHAGRRVSERSRAALRRRPLRAVALAAFALLLAGCGDTSARPAIYADGPRHISAFTIDGRGRLWATAAGLTGHKGDGLYLIAQRGGTSAKVAGGLIDPLGLAWIDGKLFVSSLGKVTAFSGFDGRHFRSRHVILDGPVRGGENNNLVRAPNGRIVMGISASCDHCIPASKWSAAVVSFNPDGSDIRVVASGIRAPFGLAYAEGTLYATLNQRDDLGDKTPGDWLVAVRKGQDWGFPRCYGQDTADCQGVPAPFAVLDEHAAAGGVAVVGSSAYVAEWQTGKVLRVSLDTGKVTSFLTTIQSPLAVVADYGAILVGDWSSGTIYRVPV